MEKLELKHIVGFTPYGLKVLDLGINELHEVVGFDNRVIYYKEGIGDYLKNIRPILRPMSDLTKEIEVDGVKFVPINKLLDIETGVNWSESKYLFAQSGVKEYWARLKDEKKTFVFGFNSEKGFFYMLNRFSEEKHVRHQKELFEKLYEWYFDIHDLIGKGLAININEPETWRK